MASSGRQGKPHAVVVPCPAQGHINPLLKFSKLLHSNGFHVSFVHTEAASKRILTSSGSSSLDGMPNFCFETITDGLFAENEDLGSLCLAMRKTLTDPFRQLIKRLNESSTGPRVTCIVYDSFLSFTLDVGEELGIPSVSFCPMSARGFLGGFYYKELIERGIIPLKSEDDRTNGYLETPIDWMPGMKNMRLKDFPSSVQTTDPNDVILNYVKDVTQDSLRATAIVIHTLDDLEGPTIDASSSLLPPLYTIGPLNLMCHQISLDDSLKTIGHNLWKENKSCLEWLEGKAPGSVIYVNFGSLAVMTRQQLMEFAWGLVDSGYEFLWVIRPDILQGDSTVNLLEEFLLEVRERSLLVSWCPQEDVLMHPSIGGFLMHGGWNSTMESISFGIPMIIWPYSADNPTNCRYACKEWGIGLEIENNVKREAVSGLIKELMVGETGKDMRRMALKWKKCAAKAAKPDGKSFLNLDRLINEVLLLKK